MSNKSEDPVVVYVRLQLEGDSLCFVVSRSSNSGEHQSIPVGAIAAIRRHIRHEPINAAELEAVIAEVEDLIMPPLRLLPPADALEVIGLELREVIQAVSPSANGQPVSIDAIESFFNRLADVASGSPLVRLGVPYTASLALCLVVLREVMHHGGYHFVTAVDRRVST